MYFFLIIALIIAAITFINSGISLPDILSAQKGPQTQELSSRPSSLKRIEQPASFALDTLITSGPAQGASLIEEKVSFEFTGSAEPEQERRITFETKVVGIDEDWKGTSGNKRTITLPPGPGEYTFFVRAKLSNVVDLSPASRTFFTNTSPYLGKVKLSSVRTKSPPFSITLATNLSSDENVNITGWRIEGNTGGFEIRQGIAKFHPTKNTVLSDIILHRSDKVLIFESRSPFGRNVSFRPNLCFGYLKPYYAFPLPIPSSCPDKPTLQETSNLAPTCQDFILKNVKTSSCTIPDFTGIQGDRECISYIQNRYNYDACYTLHSAEPGFDKNEWHVYAERSFGHPLHDTIELLDQDGLLIDSYIY